MIQIQIFYEIAMMIGNSLDLNKMLKTSLTSYLKKLSCNSGVIYRMVQTENKTRQLLPQCAIPRDAHKKRIFKDAIKDIPEISDENEFTHFLSILPIHRDFGADQNCYVLELPGFGLLVLVKSGGKFHNSILQSLNQLNHKLANSAIACLQNEEIIEINKQLSREIGVRKKAEKAKSRFLANISHEMLTPMNGIIGVNELLSTSGLNDEQADLLNSQHKSAESLLEILTHLFDVSRIEAGKIKMDLVQFNVKQLISDLISRMNDKARAKNLELICDISSEIPEYIKGDPKKIGQILTNLITNAIKFTQEGCVIIKSRLKSQSDNKLELEFEVKDTGIGIPFDKQEFLFENFTQIDESDTRKFGGAGLGLAISKKLAALMEGHISISKSDEKGSEFKLTINVDPVDIVDLSGCKPGINITDLTVLIVDDNPVNLKVLQGLCKKLKWRVESANNGKQAIGLLENQDYDIVFMDCQMPEMNGYEATKIIRDPDSNVRNHDVPVIAVTANISDDNRKKCHMAGMNDFIPKPVKIEMLHTVIQNIFN